MFTSSTCLAWKKECVVVNYPVTPANGDVTEGKGTKYAEFGYLVTKFIFSAARGSHYQYVEPRSQAMTA